MKNLSQPGLALLRRRRLGTRSLSLSLLFGCSCEFEKFGVDVSVSVGHGKLYSEKGGKEQEVSAVDTEQLRSPLTGYLVAFALRLHVTFTANFKVCT